MLKVTGSNIQKVEKTKWEESKKCSDQYLQSTLQKENLQYIELANKVSKSLFLFNNR